MEHQSSASSSGGISGPPSLRLSLCPSRYPPPHFLGMKRVTDADSLLGLGVVSLSSLRLSLSLPLLLLLLPFARTTPTLLFNNISTLSPPSLPHQTDAKHTTLMTHKGSSQDASVC